MWLDANSCCVLFVIGFVIVNKRHILLGRITLSAERYTIKMCNTVVKVCFSSLVNPRAICVEVRNITYSLAWHSTITTIYYAFCARHQRVFWHVHFCQKQYKA